MILFGTVLVCVIIYNYDNILVWNSWNITHNIDDLNENRPESDLQDISVPDHRPNQRIVSTAVEDLVEQVLFFVALMGLCSRFTQIYSANLFVYFIYYICINWQPIELCLTLSRIQRTSIYTHIIIYTTQMKSLEGIQKRGAIGQWRIWGGAFGYFPFGQEKNQPWP